MNSLCFFPEKSAWSLEPVNRKELTLGIALCMSTSEPTKRVSSLQTGQQAQQGTGTGFSKTQMNDIMI